MNLHRYIAYALVVLMLVSTADLYGADVTKVTPVWNLTEGFQLPEIAYYDAKSKKVYVSNMGKAPDARDGSEYLTIISVEGKSRNRNGSPGSTRRRGFGPSRILSGWRVLRARRNRIVDGEGSETGEARVAKFLNDVAIPTVVYVSTSCKTASTPTTCDTNVFLEARTESERISIDNNRLVVRWQLNRLHYQVPPAISFYLATKQKKLITNPDPT